MRSYEQIQVKLSWNLKAQTVVNYVATQWHWIISGTFIFQGINLYLWVNRQPELQSPQIWDQLYHCNSKGKIGKHILAMRFSYTSWQYVRALSALPPLLGVLLATQGQLDKSCCEEKAVWGGPSEGSPLPRGCRYLWLTSTLSMLQMCCSHVCVWPGTSLVWMLDLDYTAHPVTLSLWTCPSV